MITKQFSRVLAALALVGLCASAHAASTWQFGGVDGGAATTSYTTAEGKLDISGAYVASGASSFTTGNTNAALKFYNGGGLGMASDGSGQPNHALDNVGSTEMVLMNFSQSVVLTSIGIGYWDTDADISVFRYNSTGAPNLSGTTATLNGLTTAGWTLVGNYGDVTTDKSSPFALVNGVTNATTAAPTANSVGSSWWLVMAYNSTLAGTSAKSGVVGDSNDYFKLFGVTTTVCRGSAAKDCGKMSVPEPTSLALVSVALVGAAGLRRRRQKVAA